MKLFCPLCKIEASNNVAVYENVDSYTVHCGVCNEPLASFAFDEPCLFSTPEEVQPDLFEGAFGDPEEEVDYDSDYCDCAFCNQEAITFTREDLEVISKTLTRRATVNMKAFDELFNVINKVNTILEIPECL